MKKIVAALLCGTLVMALPASPLQSATPVSESFRPPAPPNSFLRTDLSAWQTILDKPLTANFRDAHLRDIVSFLATKTQANMVIKLEATIPPATDKEIPLINRNFERVPLRSILYQISLDTGLKIDWLEERGFPRAIRIHRP